jgi:GTPase SAR1 family protein
MSVSPAEALELLLSTVEDLDDSVVNARIGLSGDPGVGKTVLAMEIAQGITPPDKEILFIDSADGFLVLKNPRHVHLTNRVRRMRFEDYSQIHLLCQAISSQKVPQFANVGCIVADEASSMAEKDLDAVTVAGATKDSRNPDVSEWPDFNIAKNRFTRMLDALCGLEAHVIFITHVKKDKSFRGSLSITPSFPQAVTSRYVRPLHVSGLVRADLIRDTNTDAEPKYTRTVQVHPTTDVWGFKTKIEGLGLIVTPNKLRDAVVEFVNGKRGANTSFDEELRQAVQYLNDNDDMIEVI